MKLLELEKVCFNYECGEQQILKNLDLVIESGTCYCISGPTGSGKSSLLTLLAGLQQRPYEGTISREPDILVGLVMQDPQVQILRKTVGAEVAFVLENLGVNNTDMTFKVQHALRRVGLFVSLDTPIDSLSLGQKYRLMIAAQLVCEPAILLLDEPWAQLDDNGVDELTSVLETLLRDGISVILVEHNGKAFSSIVDHYLMLHKGQLIAGNFTCKSPFLVESVAVDHHQEILSINAFEYRYQGQELLFNSPEPLSVGTGELITLVGHNGSGKSSLLKSIAGIQSMVMPLSIKLFDKKPKLGIFGKRFGLLMQRPNRQLFESTVIDELRFSLKRFGLPLSQANELLAQLNMAHLANHSPHTLSYGQQHIIAMASIACYSPELLLLDDPLAGLDQIHLGLLLQIINQLRAKGSSVIIATHRPLPQLPVTQSWVISNKSLQVNNNMLSVASVC